MIRPSPEIEAIVARWARMIQQHDVADLPHLLSQSEALLYVGTSHDEIWRDQILRDGLSDHLAEVPDFFETEPEIEAWENGDTGWAFYKCRFTIPGTGATGIHRITFVFVMERGAWKMVQHHISQPDSNMEKLGIEHKALSRLVEAALAENHDFGTEGLASIMFTDVANSTALNAALGDRLWLSALARQMKLVASLVAEHGGTLVKSMGDGTMSAFSSARAAMAAACAMQTRVAASADEPPLNLRIGIHTGEVIRSQDDFFGTVVNKAARIAALAGPGEIRVSDATRLMTGPGDDLRFSDPIETALRGLPGTHVHHRLEWRASD